MSDYKYIKGFNFPFLKYQNGSLVRILNITHIYHILYNSSSAFIYSKDGTETQINIEPAKEIDEFLMNTKFKKTPSTSGVSVDIGPR